MISYGEHGFRIIVNCILLRESDVVDGARLVRPDMDAIDDFESFARNVGAHQVAAVLVSEDYQIGLAHASHMVWLSEPYGKREFPVNESETVLAELESSLHARRVNRRKRRAAPKTGLRVPERITRSTRPEGKCLLPGLGMVY